MIKVNGQLIPTPSAYDVTIIDIDGNTARTASGLMVRDRIAVKRKIEMGWNFLTKEELSGLLNLVQNIFFEVEYIDSQTGELKTGTFYVGDRRASGLDYLGEKIRWKDVKMSFIER